MFKYYVLFFCFISTAAQSEVINYVTSDQQELSQNNNGIKTIVVDDDALSDLDKMAAEHGDTHAMGTLANTCLSKQDYECAYKWAGIALRGNYWQSQGLSDRIEDIQNKAKSHLTEEQINNSDKAIKEFRPR